MTHFSFETEDIVLPKGAWAKTHRRTLCWQGKEILAFTQGEFRPYLYPVFSPAGFIVTTESPADHRRFGRCVRDHPGGGSLLPAFQADLLVLPRADPTGRMHHIRRNDAACPPVRR